MQVSRSAYYAYVQGKSYVWSPQKAAIAGQVKAEFYRHRRRYGSRRLAAELKEQGVCCGRFQVRTVMRRESLRAIRPRRLTPRTTDSRHTVGPSPNLLDVIGNKVFGSSPKTTLAMAHA